MEQWIRKATDYKIVVVPDTRHLIHVPPVSGTTTTVQLGIFEGANLRRK